MQLVVLKRARGVKVVGMVLTRQRVDSASGTLPREEEEPREMSYAAAETWMGPGGVGS